MKPGESLKPGEALYNVKPGEALYNGKPGESLDSLRYKRFCEKIATNTSRIHPQTLPPTSATAKYHSLQVYFQILEWKGHS